LIPEWFRARPYPHFDAKVNKKRAWDYVQDPGRVRAHSFYPFIKYIKKIPRYRPDSADGPTVIKEREIYYAAHLDSYIYAYYSQLIYGELEKRLRSNLCNESVIAYRKQGKCNIDYAHEAFGYIASKGECVALAFDVSKFFDSLDHRLLGGAWKAIFGVERLPDDHYQVFKSLTAFSFVLRQHLHSLLEISDTKSENISRICQPEVFRGMVRRKGLIQKNKNPYGIPQGSPISAVLSNLYMFEFDCKIAKIAADNGEFYRRYCDDILYVCQPSRVAEVRALIDGEMKALCLSVNLDKVEEAWFERKDDGTLGVNGKPLQYLGFMFDGVNTLIRSSSLARYYRKMKQRVAMAADDASKNKTDDRIYLRKVYRLYSHLGKQNFISYGKRSAGIMQSTAIKRQIGRHWKKLQSEISKYRISSDGET
jgi:hypothetical protein